MSGDFASNRTIRNSAELGSCSGYGQHDPPDRNLVHLADGFADDREGVVADLAVAMSQRDRLTAVFGPCTAMSPSKLRMAQVVRSWGRRAYLKPLAPRYKQHTTCDCKRLIFVFTIVVREADFDAFPLRMGSSRDPSVTRASRRVFTHRQSTT